MSDNYRSQDYKIIRILLLGSGIFFLLIALFYNEFSLALFKPHKTWTRGVLVAIRTTDIWSLALGFFLVLLSDMIRRITFIRDFASKESVTNVALFALVLLIPLTSAELIGKPLQSLQKAIIFSTDDELGWKLKPLTEDIHAGATVKVNGKGLVGPEVDYARQPKTLRILYLGDSITMGYGYSDYRITYPYQIETLLENKTGLDIETVNAAVSGYATWQEFIYLVREGIRYSPDFVVLGFALNDVIDLFKMKVEETKTCNVSGERISLTVRRMPLIYTLYITTGTGYFISSFRSMLFPRQRNADLTLDTRSAKALLFPDRSPDINEKWDLAFQDVSKIAGLCQKHQIRFLMVVFPFDFQFLDYNSDPELNGMRDRNLPQIKLRQFARDNSIPLVDVLPFLNSEIEMGNAESSDFIWDDCHLTPFGHEFVGKIIADFLQEERMVARNDSSSHSALNAASVK